VGTTTSGANHALSHSGSDFLRPGTEYRASRMATCSPAILTANSVYRLPGTLSAVTSLHSEQASSSWGRSRSSAQTGRPTRLRRKSSGWLRDDKLEHVPHGESTTYGPTWGML